MAAGLYTINLSGSGDATVVAAPSANSFIRVLHYHVTADRPTVITFKDDDGVVLDVCYATLSSGGGISTPYAEGGVLASNPGKSLVLNNSAVAKIGGVITYTIKPGA